MTQRPPIGARVRVSGWPFHGRGRVGVVVAHHEDGVTIVVEEHTDAVNWRVLVDPAEVEVVDSEASK